MSLDSLKSRIPAYARDIKLNLSNVLDPQALTEQQVWGIALASAIASRNPEVLEAIAAEAEAKLSPEAQTATRTAAALMAMNNVYYRSTHLISNPEYGKLPARLRMNAIANPGIDKLDFELISLAVSAINGCGMCLDAHEREVSGKGATKEGVQDALRIAAVIHAVAVTLEAERAALAERAAA
ncbi:carboxymuconolactone decarboxylase family protein [Algihabitans albus]|uniref:carboxymuconolactone decarboxylase family protein n=1 Tax=Algihabitans albus TaxID=2164067 RepID=UPI000E5CD5C3|nr:carboxymuconolactone decarboxylase family protein [Algihabitans albus]